jgi:hypothetical protein
VVESAFLVFAVVDAFCGDIGDFPTSGATAPRHGRENQRLALRSGVDYCPLLDQVESLRL